MKIEIILGLRSSHQRIHQICIRNFSSIELRVCRLCLSAGHVRGRTFSFELRDVKRIFMQAARCGLSQELLHFQKARDESTEGERPGCLHAGIPKTYVEAQQRHLRR